MDSLLSIAQMPAGIPVGTLAIGEAGAANAALLAAAILATTEPDIREALDDFRAQQTRTVLDNPDPRPGDYRTVSCTATENENRVLAARLGTSM